MQGQRTYPYLALAKRTVPGQAAQCLFLTVCPLCLHPGSKCSGFHSCYTCACGQPAYAHDTVVETRQERLAQGKPVGRDVPYAAMGGLTGFSSLAEGYMRLDDSGIGK